MTSLPRRQRIKQLLSLATIGGGTLGLVQRVLAQQLRPVPPGVQSIRGEALIDGRPATPGQIVPPGAKVSTGAGAEVVFVIGQDAFLQRENSELQFGADPARDFFRLLSGKLLSVFGPGAKTLHTPTAAIGIRGTGCYLEAAPEAVYFCLCYGTAEVRPSADPEAVRQLLTRHHDQPLLIRRQGPGPLITGAAVINHRDAELTLLENLTGRWPPFHGEGGAGY